MKNLLEIKNDIIEILNIRGMHLYGLYSGGDYSGVGERIEQFIQNSPLNVIFKMILDHGTRAVFCNDLCKFCDYYCKEDAYSWMKANMGTCSKSAPYVDTFDDVKQFLGNVEEDIKNLQKVLDSAFGLNTFPNNYFFRLSNYWNDLTSAERKIIELDDGEYYGF